MSLKVNPDATGLSYEERYALFMGQIAQRNETRLAAQNKANDIYAKIQEETKAIKANPIETLLPILAKEPALGQVLEILRSCKVTPKKIAATFEESRERTTRRFQGIKEEGLKPGEMHVFAFRSQTQAIIYSVDANVAIGDMRKLFPNLQQEEPTEFSLICSYNGKSIFHCSISTLANRFNINLIG